MTKGPKQTKTNQGSTKLTSPCSSGGQEQASASREAEDTKHWPQDFKGTLASLNSKSSTRQSAGSVPSQGFGDSGTSRSTVEKFCPWTSAPQTPPMVFQAVTWADLKVRFRPVYRADNLGCLC